MKVRSSSVPYDRNNFYEVKNIFRSLNICIVPKLQFTIKNFIYLNRTTQPVLNGDQVVYTLEYTCLEPHVYIGETKREFKKRLNEHNKYIRLKQEKSGIAVHCLQNKCNINNYFIRILKQERKHVKR